MKNILLKINDIIWWFVPDFILRVFVYVAWRRAYKAQYPFLKFEQISYDMLQTFLKHKRIKK